MQLVDEEGGEVEGVEKLPDAIEVQGHLRGRRQEARRFFVTRGALVPFGATFAEAVAVRIALMAERRTVLTASGESKTSATSSSRRIGGLPLNFKSMPANRFGFMFRKNSAGYSGRRSSFRSTSGGSFFFMMFSFGAR